jgi:hypothetical protein
MVTTAPVSPPSGLMMTDVPGQISLTWNANGEPDIAGYKVYWGTANVYPFEHSIDVGNVTFYTITGLSTGDYHATVTAYDNDVDTVEDDPATIVNEIQCAGNESWYAKPVSTLGINHHAMVNEERILVFPNPTDGDFRVLVPAHAKEIKIFNFLGQLIREAHISDLKDKTELIFNLDQAGTYIIQVETEEGVISAKAVVY